MVSTGKLSYLTIGFVEADGHPKKVITPGDKDPSKLERTDNEDISKPTSGQNIPTRRG